MTFPLGGESHNVTELKICRKQKFKQDLKTRKCLKCIGEQKGLKVFNASQLIEIKEDILLGSPI